MNRNVLIVIGLLILMALPAAGETYRVYVNREFGFWAVRSDNQTHIPSYIGRVLNINTGDSVVWENDDSVGDRVTVTSDDQLWAGGKSMGGLGSRFKFTFNSSGINTFRLVENNRFNQSQTTEIVTTLENGEEVMTTGTSWEYDYYPSQHMTVKITGNTVGNGTYPINYVKPTPTSLTKGTTKQTGATVGGFRMGVGGSQAPAETVAPTPIATIKPTPTPIPAPLQSYQEFTLYEIVKRWYDIIVASNKTIPKI